MRLTIPIIAAAMSPMLMDRRPSIGPRRSGELLLWPPRSIHAVIVLCNALRADSASAANRRWETSRGKGMDEAPARAGKPASKR